MRAVVYHGPRDVRVVNVPDAKIERPTDVLVKISRTNICGSDLHMYEGRTDVELGKVLGHENLGQVVEVGEAVGQVKPGDWVCLPFSVSCGFCDNCERGFTGFCLTVNPGSAGGAYGYAGMGPYDGGQADYLRVPYGDFNCLVLPEDAQEKQADYVMLADVFPTGFHATELAGVQPGDSVVVLGAGPVGLLAAYSAVIKGAAEVLVIDRHPGRLRLAKRIGAIPIDDSKGTAVEQVLELTKGIGVDRGCECVGYQAHDPIGREQPSATMNDLFKCVRATGAIGVVGVFVPNDPNSPDTLARSGKLALDWGVYFEKGLRVGSGQTNVKAYNRRLCTLISKGIARPSFVVSHELPLEEAPRAYRHFGARDEGWTKVILNPSA